MESNMEKLQQKNRVGRPRIPVEERKTYQRIAIYPKTYTVIKKKTNLTDEQIKDYVDRLVQADNQ